MNDKIEILGKGSYIQHGQHNDRVYLIKLYWQDADVIIDEISKIAYSNKYSKLFCKVPKKFAPLFFNNGYILEGYIPKFYSGEEDLFFLSKFLDHNRQEKIDNLSFEKYNQLLKEKHKRKDLKQSQYSIRKLIESDVEKMTKIYRVVFKSYPFPIHNPDYILETMQNNVHYFGVEKDGDLVALSSSEVDVESKNAEMTDFATLPHHGGNNLSGLLLDAMEKEMKEQGIITLYTIARLNSIPMNKTFLRFDYEYSGTLINNTNISGKIESMNVYYKHI